MEENDWRGVGRLTLSLWRLDICVMSDYILYSYWSKNVK